MKVFIVGTSLRASYGGPAISVSSLARALGDAGVDVGVWAPDQSAPDAHGLSAARVKPLRGDLQAALTTFGHPDVIHDNGLWLAHNHRLAVLSARLEIPRVVSTRGMLEPWALRHKGWKKAIAWGGYQRRDLRRARLHHATSEAEGANLRQMGLGVAVEVIPNGIGLPDGSGDSHAGVGGDRVRTALFLGRIYPVKGLPMLVEAWAEVRPPGWRLEIAGPDEGGHQARLEQMVAKAGLGEVVVFRGPLDGSTKAAALAAADLLVLPSHSESFGMVVGEALAHRTPVLTTTAVPWPTLAEHGCGWRVPPTAQGLAGGLRAAVVCSPGTLREMGERGRALVATEFSWSKIAQHFVDTYQALLMQRGQGDAAESGL